MPSAKLALAAVTVVCGAAVFMDGEVAEAAAPVNGCPDGYQLLSVTDLTAAGYYVAGLVDDPGSGSLSYGRPGNGNGVICARQMGNRLTHFGGPYYNFLDDGLPAS